MVAVLPAGAVVAGLMALLFLLAWAQWGHAITQTLNVNIPIIGNALGRLVGDALEASYLVLLGWFDSAVTPVADFIVRPIVAVESIFDALNGMGQSTLNAVITITTVKIPAAISVAHQYSTDITNYALSVSGAAITNLTGVVTAGLATERAYATAVLNTADTYALNLTNYLQSQLVAGLASAQSIIAAGLATAHQFTLDAYNASINYTVTAYAAAISHADQLAAQAAADLTATATAVESYALTTATTVVAAAITDIDTSVSTALAGIYTDVDIAVDGAIGAITTGDADILAALKAWPASVPLDLAGVAALAGVTSLTLARYLRDCGIPNCQNLGQLGKDLQALLGLVEDASFLGLLVELVQHPSDASSIVGDLFGGAINDTIGSFRSLVSI